MARIQQIQVRRDTAANWITANPTLAAGEQGFESDTGLVKFGDGTTAWTSLAYINRFSIHTGYTPLPSTGYTLPANVLSVANAAPVSGVACFSPLDVGPGDGWTPQTIAVNVGTAQSGGTGTIVKAAVYADRGDGGGPLLTSAGLLFQATLDVTASGVRTAAFTRPFTPGRYWLCGFYYQGSTAPTTVPTLTCVSNATSLPTTTAAAFTVIRYLTVSGLTDLPVAGQSTGGSGASTGIIVSVRRS